MRKSRRAGAYLCSLLLAMFAGISGWAQEKPAAKPAAETKTKTARTSQMSNEASLLHPATLNAKAPEEYTVKFVTTRGDFTVKVTRALAPLGADRFYNLTKHHFFDGAAFFRVVPGFVVQFGLSADPAVSAAWQKATFKDDPVKGSNRKGFLTFATAGANTRTTQLFINLGDNARLDSMGFSAFGQVTEGMDVVEHIYSGYGERPDQGAITSQGKAYLDKNFPKLDSVKSTVVTPVATAVPK
jgi:peptidyl-prolyl cis-trans isomerase A (cyclophilin A)